MSRLAAALLLLVLLASPAAADDADELGQRLRDDGLPAAYVLVTDEADGAGVSVSADFSGAADRYDDAARDVAEQVWDRLEAPVVQVSVSHIGGVPYPGGDEPPALLLPYGQLLQEFGPRDPALDRPADDTPPVRALLGLSVVLLTAVGAAAVLLLRKGRRAEPTTPGWAPAGAAWGSPGPAPSGAAAQPVLPAPVVPPAPVDLADLWKPPPGR